MSKEYLDKVCLPDQEVNPLFSFLQARLIMAENSTAKLELPLSPNLGQGGGKVAGGILATLADEAMAHAVLSILEPGQSVVTAELNIRYLRGANPCGSGVISAEARVVKAGSTLHVAEADVIGPEGELLATAGATFCLVRKALG